MRRLALIALVGGLAACTANSAPCTSPEAPPLRIGIADPRGARARPVDVFRQDFLIASTLIALDPHGVPQPALAESWETTDRRAWTFTLRPDIRNHRGQPVTATRIREALVQEAAQNKGFFPVWADLEGIEVPTPRQLVFRFARPVSGFPETLAQVYLGGATEGDLSAGAWRLTQQTRDGMELAAFPGDSRDRTRLARLQVEVFDSTRAAWAAFLRNRVDLLQEVPSSAVSLLAQNPDIRLHINFGRRVYALGFQVQNPWLRDVRVRQAINLAIDRDALVRRLYGGSPKLLQQVKAAAGPFSPDYWAAAGASTGWRYDPQAARTLIETVLREHGRTDPIELNCITTSELADIAEVAANIEAQLERVHIRLRLQPLRYDELIGRLTRGDFDTFVNAVAAGYSSMWPYSLWRSSNPRRPMNITGYQGADGELDRLYAAASPDEERAGVRAVLDAMHRDPPAAFLTPLYTIRAVRSTWQVPDDEPDIRKTLHRWRIDSPCHGS